MMPGKHATATLTDALKEAILASGLSYSRIATLARIGQGAISFFMLGQRDVTLGTASRLCEALGYALTKVGEPAREPLAVPTPTMRSRKKGVKPISAHVRGQGKRIDLETNEQMPMKKPGRKKKRGPG